MAFKNQNLIHEPERERETERELTMYERIALISSKDDLVQSLDKIKWKEWENKVKMHRDRDKEAKKQ